ncbi:MAG: DUF3419 family protein [Thermoguttaceae bacterium]
MKKIGDWFSSRVFRMVHENNLVYNTCWEDPRLDKVALELTPEDNLLVITSAGCNALSYALTGLKHVYTVDVNPRQNAVLELKIAGIKNLDYPTFFKMFGEGVLPEIEEVYSKQLRPSLPEYAQKIWDKRIIRYFGGRKRRSFYFCGTSGMFARVMRRYINHIGRFRNEVNEILACKTIEEQRDIWFNKIRKKLWSPFVKMLVNRDASLSMLGVPRAQRMQIDKQYEGGIIKFVQDALDSVFGTLPIADNYFWRVYATGCYTPTCCPEYLEEENFQKLKGGLVDRISVATDTVEGFLRKNDVQISRFVLLDHMDWLSDQLYDALVSEWDIILDRAAPQTRILWRSGGLRTDYIDTVPVEKGGEKRSLSEYLTYNRELASELHKQDRVHTYGSFYIADLKRP